MVLYNEEDDNEKVSKEWINLDFVYLLFKVVGISTFVLHISSLSSFSLNLFLIRVKLFQNPFTR